MHVLFIAAGWVDLMRLLPFVIAFLVWVIGRFATNLPQKPPQRATRLPKPAAPQTPQQQGDPLQSEINEFLQQARSAQEGRASSNWEKWQQRPNNLAKRCRLHRAELGTHRESERLVGQRQLNRILVRVGKKAGRFHVRPCSQLRLNCRALRFIRSRPANRLHSTLLNRSIAPNSANGPLSLARCKNRPIRNFASICNACFSTTWVALRRKRRAFSRPLEPPQMRHRPMCLQRQPPRPQAQSGTAPVATHKRTSDIALFLAGRKNIRDAVILSEILQRPEHRW